MVADLDPVDLAWAKAELAKEPLAAHLSPSIPATVTSSYFRRISTMTTPTANRTIWKFPVEIGPNHIRAPHGSKFLSIGWQEPRLVAWAEVDPWEDYSYYLLHVVGTGFEIEKSWRYHGTVQVGQYVWHLYQDAAV